MNASARRHLFADHQGSVIGMADGNGAPIGINRYDDWGVPDASNVGRFQFTGQAWLPDLGMYLPRRHAGGKGNAKRKARIYSPTLGRFLQTDPIGYQDQFNLYAYVGNDPVNARDSTGMCELNADNAEVGLCPNSGEAAVVVANQLADENSIAVDVDADASRRGVRIGLETTENDADVDGAQFELNRGGGGTIRLDMGDEVTMENPDGDVNFATVPELVEHELNNALNNLNDGPRDRGTGDHAGSIGVENAYRARIGNPFVRTPETRIIVTPRGFVIGRPR